MIATLAHLATDAMKECLERGNVFQDEDVEIVELALDRISDRPRAVDDPELKAELKDVREEMGPRSLVMYRCYRILGYSHKLAFALSYLRDEPSANQ